MLGVKELLVESALMRPLDRLVSMPVLKAHDCPRVQQVQKIFDFEIKFQKRQKITALVQFTRLMDFMRPIDFLLRVHPYES
jgi:hypothetical protein